jgi:hypothetical protein
MTYNVHVHIIGKSGRSVNLTTNRCIMCRQRAFIVIFSKRPAGHGKGLRGPRVEDPWARGTILLFVLEHAIYAFFALNLLKIGIDVQLMHIQTFSVNKTLYVLKTIRSSYKLHCDERSFMSTKLFTKVLAPE